MSGGCTDFFKLINDTIADHVINKCCGNKVEIKEDAKNTRGKFVNITNITKAIALGLDVNKKDIYFLKNNTKINDQTIIHYDNGKVLVILLELKSDKIEKATKQILSGKAYIEFLLSILSVENKITISEVEYRAFIFTSKRIPVRKTTKKIRNLEPDRILDGVALKKLGTEQTYNFNELILPLKK